MRRRRLMLCPDCSRRGVYLKLGMDDAYVCRYAYRGCAFYAYARGSMTVDLDGRHRLSAANPGCVI